MATRGTQAITTQFPITFDRLPPTSNTTTAISAYRVRTAKEFYDAIALGGREEKLANGKGLNTRLADGTVITWREVSSSDGTPAIDINISQSNDSGGIKRQKIHFVLKED